MARGLEKALPREGLGVSARSIIDGAKLEIALWMSADRALQRSVFADHDVTAVAAFPNGKVISDVNDAAFDVLQKFAISLLMGLLDLGDHLKLVGDFLEAFLVGGLGEPGIHVGPLIVFAGGGRG